MIDRPRVPPYQVRSCPGWGSVEAAIVELEQRGEWMRVAALLLLVDVGLRRAEASSRDVEHFDRVASTIHVRRKGGLEITRTISARCNRAICRAIGGRTSGPLLLSAAGHRAAPTTIADWTLGLGLGRPHAMRRAGATELRRRGESTELISAYLGHQSIATTQVYVRVLDDEPGRATRVLAQESDAPPPLP